MRQLEATLKDKGGFSAADHIHCSAASHCFSSRTWQPQLLDLDLATAARVLVIFLLTICPLLNYVMLYLCSQSVFISVKSVKQMQVRTAV